MTGQLGEAEETALIIDFDTHETIDRQVFQPQQRRATAQRETTLKQLVIRDTDERNLRSLCRQAYRRMKKQADPTTPTENYVRYKAALEKLDYTIIEGESEVELLPPANRREVAS